MKQLFTCLLGLMLFMTTASAQVSTFPWTEDFENEATCGTSCSGTCILSGQMFNDTLDQQDWLVNSGPTISSNTGPSGDHTTGAGNYLYMENSGCSTTDEAHLLTPIFDFTSTPNPQLSFWYHMYGADMDSMHLDVNTGSGWVLDVVPGWIDDLDLWQQKVVNLSAFGGQSSVRFRVRGKHGSSFAADQALDDFAVISLVPNNAAMVSIDNPVLPSCILGATNVDVTFDNVGTNVIDTVTIGWSINGTAQTPFLYTTSIPVDSSATATIGTTSFSNGDVLQIWTSMPNNSMDMNPADDTLNLIVQTGLNGTYTLDPALPASVTNFQSIADIQNAIGTIGLCGNTVINVAPGTYNATIAIQDGFTDSTKTLTFNGAGMGQTILSADGTGTPIIFLDGADYITFRNMTIENTSTTGGFSAQAWAIRLANAANHNTFDSCHVIVADTTSPYYVGIAASGSATSVFSTGDNANYTTISNCIVEGGYYGITFYNTTANGYTQLGTQNQFINNHLRNIYAYGIRFYYQEDGVIRGNIIEAPTSPTFGYGMYLFNNKHPRVEKNQVGQCGTYGLYLGNTNIAAHNATLRGQVVNNMFSAKGAGDAAYIPTATNVDFYHNSCYAEDDQALYTTGTLTGIDFRNNIFYAVNATAIDFSTAIATTGNAFNYNVIYRETAGDLAENGSASYSDLADWKNLQPNFNLNSVQGNPNFVDPANGDLHVTVGAALVAGDNLVGITEDFDGDARPLAPTTTVDAGADEILVQNIDAGVTAFVSPAAPVSPGTQDIIVAIKNNGIQTLTSATVNWSVDGVLQTPFSWAGSLPINTEDNNVVIGSFNIPVGSSQFVAWTSAPNGSTDGNMANDTTVQDVCTAYRGTYTVGADMNDDFPTIAAAAEALAICGVDSAVHIMVDAGTYTDAVLFTEIAGADSMNTITIDGGDKDSVLISYATGNEAQNAAVLFNGADYVTLQNMTIENTATTGSVWGIRLQNASDNNTIQDCRIQLDPTTTNFNSVVVLASSSATSSSGQGNNCNGLHLLNNEIVSGYYGVRLYGETSSYNQNNVIEGNDFIETYGYANYLYYQEGIIVKDNHIPSFRATFGYGIYIVTSTSPTVEANFIGEAGSFGIYLTTVNQGTVTQRGRIVNNMVNVTGAGAEALYFFNADEMDIFNNTFNATSEQAFYTDNSTGLDIRSNIFSNVSNDVVDFNDALTANDVVNYNLYYRANPGVLIREVGIVFQDLASWQSSTQNGGLYDDRSLEGNPIYKDVSTGDLHILGGLPNNVGDNGTGVTVDIDGDMRPMAPASIIDMGADEYTPLDKDLRLVDFYMTPNGCNVAADSIWAIVQSFGLDPVTVFSTTANISGAISQTITNTLPTSLMFLQMDTVYVGSINTLNGGIYNCEVAISLAGDQNPENDTAGTITIQRMAAPNAVIKDVACEGELLGEVALNFAGTGTIATVDETQFRATPSLNETFSFTGLSGISGVTLEITGHGDLDGTGGNLEEYAILDENGVQIGQYGAFGTFALQCADAPANVITISDADYAAWAADGVITFSAVGTGAVSTTLCGANAFLQLKLSGNGTLSLTWNTGDTIPTISGLSAGTYNVSVTDLLGCSQTASFTVDSTTTPKPALSVDAVNDVSCFGANDGSIDVSVTGGAGAITYMWSNGATSQNLTGIGAGSYAAMITDEDGCMDSTSTAAVVTQPDSLNAALASIDTLGCNSIQISTNVTGGTGAYSFSWNNGSTDTTLAVTTAGTYFATVTDANGCTDVLSASVAFPATLSSYATVMSEDTSGKGVGAIMATATGGTAPYTYAWSNGATTAEATGLSFGTYTVTITDALGCTTTASNTIGFPLNAANLTHIGAIDMFPNPTSGTVTFNVVMKEANDLNITIYNAIGQEVANFNAGNVDRLTQSFDASNIAAGIYMVRFTAGNDVVTKRLVVKK